MQTIFTIEETEAQEHDCLVRTTVSYCHRSALPVPSTAHLHMDGRTGSSFLFLSLVPGKVKFLNPFPFSSPRICHWRNNYKQSTSLPPPSRFPVTDAMSRCPSAVLRLQPCYHLASQN